LQAAGTPTSAAAGAALSEAELGSAVQAALQRLSAAGVSPTVLGELGSASYLVGALPPSYAGLASPSSHSVWVSPDAASFGWFPDGGPSSDSQFDSQGKALPGSAAAG